MPEARRRILAEWPEHQASTAAFFTAADTSGDFYLSPVEFGMLLRVLSAWHKAESKGARDGKVSMAEVKKSLGRALKASKGKKLASLFIEFDGGDFYMTPKEFYAFYKKLVA